MLAIINITVPSITPVHYVIISNVYPELFWL